MLVMHHLEAGSTSECEEQKAKRPNNPPPSRPQHAERRQQTLLRLRLFICSVHLRDLLCVPVSVRNGTQLVEQRRSGLPERRLQNGTGSCDTQADDHRGGRLERRPVPGLLTRCKARLRLGRRNAPCVRLRVAIAFRKLAECQRRWSGAAVDGPPSAPAPPPCNSTQLARPSL